MKLYAESSAVLAWLLGEAAAPAVGELLERSELLVASDLVHIECERALIRAVATRNLPEADAADRRAVLHSATAHWHLMRIDERVVERARRPFPGEPIRTLDALHLASALLYRASVRGLAILSLDRRLRASAKGLGFTVIPA